MDGADLVFRELYAVVPRAVIERYQHEPWDFVIAAAARGDDGLAVLHGRPRRWFSREDVTTTSDIAYLAQGQYGEWEKKTVLHQQNW